MEDALNREELKVKEAGGLPSPTQHLRARAEMGAGALYPGYGVKPEIFFFPELLHLWNGPSHTLFTSQPWACSSFWGQSSPLDLLGPTPGSWPSFPEVKPPLLLLGGLSEQLGALVYGA